MAGNLAEVVYTNQGAKRNLPVNEHLMRAIQEGVTSVYGADYRVEIMSGAQGEGSNGSTGSRRHTTGTAGDVWVYAPDGKRLSGDDLIPLAQHWRGTSLGSVGFPSNNSNSLHLDLVGGKGPGSVPRQKGEGDLWYYGTPSQAQRSALTSGALPKYAISPSAVAQGFVPPGSLPTVGTLTDTAPTVSPGPRVAPTPAGPLQQQFAFENAGMRPDLRPPANLVADSLAAAARAQPGGSALADMFGPAVNGNTPRLQDGAVASPMDTADWASNIFPNTARRPQQTLTQPGAIDAQVAGLRPSASTKAALEAWLKPKAPAGPNPADIRALRTANQAAADAERAVGGPPTTRSVASVPMGPQKPSAPAVDPVGASSSWSDFAAMFGRPAYNSNAHPFAGGGPKAIPGPNSQPKSAERLPASSGINLVNTRPDNFNPYGAEVLPFDTAFVPPPPKRPETRTITEQVPNPDWTADLAAKGVPAGMKVNFGSRDTVAQRAAGAKVPQFITRTRQVPVATPAAAVVAARAPVPFSRPAAPAARAPLRIVVNGGNAQPAPAPSPSTWAPSGYTNDGSGKITSNETGGVYYERHLR